MATVHIECTGTARLDGAVILRGAPTASEAITSSGVSQQSSITGDQGQVARIVSIGGAVYVVAGQNPTASAQFSYLVPNGGSIDIGPLNQNDKVAVIDA